MSQIEILQDELNEQIDAEYQFNTAEQEQFNEAMHLHGVITDKAGNEVATMVDGEITFIKNLDSMVSNCCSASVSDFGNCAECKEPCDSVTTE